MNFVTRNIISWNRRAISRAQRSAYRAKTPDQRRDFENDISRYEGNIERLYRAA